jgi:hypothetical protein
MSEETKDNSKRIYKYHNGEKEVYADPFEIDWRMQDSLKMTPDIDTIDKRLSPEVDPDTGEFTKQQIQLLNDAYHFYIPHITKVFGLKKFDSETGEGMTGQEIIELWNKYLEWRYEVKKNTE